MTTDVRTLLHDSADAPSRPLDIDGAMRSAHATVGVAVVASVRSWRWSCSRW